MDAAVDVPWCGISIDCSFYPHRLNSHLQTAARIRKREDGVESEGDEENRSTGNHTGTEAGDQALVSSAVGRRLRSMYQKVADEPVPDRFLDLLKQLESEGPKSQ